MPSIIFNSFTRLRRFIGAFLLVLGLGTSSSFSIEVELDTSAVPELSAWGKEAKELLEDWHPRLVNLMRSPDHEDYEKVVLKIRKSEKGVASTSGNVISVSSGWIQKHPEDLGVAIHELIHVLQRYKRPQPWWITEGIADYYRWAIYEGKPLEKFPRPKKAKGYEKGYQMSAGFLFWIQSEVAPGIVETLNGVMRKGTYSPAFFEEQTGKSLKVLWADYLRVSSEGRSK